MNWENHFIPGGNACRGCGSILAARLAQQAVYASSKDALVFGESCGGGIGELHTASGLGMDSATLSGFDVALQLRGHPEKRLVLITGEGRIAESAFEGFSAAIARGQNITFILLDNQGFSNSGSHQTATTTMGAKSAIHPEGKATPQKNVALMMIFNRAKYVATASPAFPSDLRQKVFQAVQNQPSVVQIYCPCITTWGMEPSDTIALSRMAATNGLFPIWEFKDNVFKVTVKPRKREPVRAYLELQRRYRGVSEEVVQALDAEGEQLFKIVEGMERTFPG